MLTHHRRPVCLSLISTDLPILSTTEAAATLYQKDQQWFHILLNQPEIPHSITKPDVSTPPNPNNRLLWLEVSPDRVIMTMQGNSKLAYRHFWEKGLYGSSRYWLNGDPNQIGGAFRLRNFTRNLQLRGSPLPQYLRVEYELWAPEVQLGHYVLHLEVYH